jgi:hypothetical protein
MAIPHFTMGGNIRTDHPATGKQGFRNWQSEAFGY